MVAVAVPVSAPKGPDDIGQHADQRPSLHNSRGIRGRDDSAPCLVQATIGTPRPQRHGSCPQRTTPLRQRRGPMQATAPVAAAWANHSTSARTAAAHMPPRCCSNAALPKLAPPSEANPSEQEIPAVARQLWLCRRVPFWRWPDRPAVSPGLLAVVGRRGLLSHLSRQGEGKPCASEQHCPVLRRGQAAG